MFFVFIFSRIDNACSVDLDFLILAVYCFDIALSDFVVVEERLLMVRRVSGKGRTTRSFIVIATAVAGAVVAVVGNIDDSCGIPDLEAYFYQ